MRNKLGRGGGICIFTVAAVLTGIRGQRVVGAKIAASFFGPVPLKTRTYFKDDFNIFLL